MDPIETLLSLAYSLARLAGVEPAEGGLGVFQDLGAAFVAVLFPAAGFLLGHPALAFVAFLAFAALDPYWRAQLGRGASRFLNGVFRGEGDVTFSAWSEELRRRGSRWGALRVSFVDGLPFNGAGHCAAAWTWHKARGLLETDDASVVPEPSPAV